jgi:hypothetical protein
MHTSGLTEKCGLWVGAALAPLTAGVSRFRHARMFHPDGVVYQASVEPCTERPDLRALAERLSGTCLARFSSALWRRDHEWPDVLGVALRRRWEPLVRVTLVAAFDVDQSALHFSPFNDAAGLQPVGFVHAIRVHAYSGSCSGRDATRAEHPENEAAE